MLMDEEEGGDGNTPTKAGGLPKRCFFAPPARHLLPGGCAGTGAMLHAGDCAAHWRIGCVKRTGTGRGKSSRPRAEMVGTDGVGAGGLQPHMWWAPGRCERCKRAKKGAQYCFGIPSLQ
jgi:hypothetical protein